MLVLKDVLGGPLKITPDNSNNLARQKIASKESLGKENGDFRTQSALFWGDRKRELFDPETLLCRFWGF